MSNEGERLRQRRERLGIDKKALAEAAGVNRNTLAAIENGESFNRSSLAKLERVLDELEHEAGLDAPPAAPTEADLIEFDISDEFGLHLVVKGPIANADILKRQVIDIIREIRAESPPD